MATLRIRCCVLVGLMQKTSAPVIYGKPSAGSSSVLSFEDRRNEYICHFRKRLGFPTLTGLIEFFTGLHARRNVVGAIHTLNDISRGGGYKRGLGYSSAGKSSDKPHECVNSLTLSYLSSLALARNSAALSTNSCICCSIGLPSRGTGRLAICSGSRCWMIAP